MADKIELEPVQSVDASLQAGTLPSGWRIQVSVTRIAGRPEVSSMTLEPPVDRPQAITARAWRAVPVGAVIDAARANYGEMQKIVEGAYEEMHQEWVDSWARSPGRQGHSDEMYARLAQQYAASVGVGSRSPVEDLAKSMETSRATASQRLQTARARGLLSKSELTEKAFELLGILILDLTALDETPAPKTKSERGRYA